MIPGYLEDLTRPARWAAGAGIPAAAAAREFHESIVRCILSEKQERVHTPDAFFFSQKYPKRGVSCYKKNMRFCRIAKMGNPV